MVALLAFGGYYYTFSKAHEEKLRLIEVTKQKAIDAKLEKDRADRKKAAEDAQVQVAKRKQDREDKAAKEKREKEDREKAVEAKSRALSEEFNLRTKADRIAKELDVAKAELQKVQEQILRNQKEETHLVELVKKVQSNQKTIQTVAEKVEKADDVIRRAFKDLTTLRTAKTPNS
jgi:colicin import membrane protein